MRLGLVIDAVNVNCKFGMTDDITHLFDRSWRFERNGLRLDPTVEFTLDLTLTRHESGKTISIFAVMDCLKECK
jgi:hypothetical protein